MQFEKITATNLRQTYPYLYAADYRLCDYAPCVLLLWAGYFDYYFAICDNALFIRQTRKGITEFLMPVTSPDNLAAAFDTLKRHCKQEGIPMNIVAIPQNYASRVENILGATASDMGDDEADYASNAVDLATLVGRRFNAKRNHVNRFKRDNPNAVFKVLTKDDKPALEEFLENYYKNTDSASYNYDIQTVSQFVKKFDEFDFCGGAIVSEEKILAASFGDIVGDTLIVHIEKALRNISGLYETMTHLFAKHFANPSVQYVNREDDMGDLGLRAAKLSYCPEVWRKYSLAIPCNQL